MRLLVFAALIAATPAVAQTTTYADAVAEERAAFDAELADPNATLLDPRARAVFEGLPYYALDPAYRVEAAFTPTPDAEPFTMATSAGTQQTYVEVGVAAFRLRGADLVLHAYEAVPSNSDSLFLPFRDATTGKATYGGGRYLYAFPPEDGRIVLDFNTASNPYCAYSAGYACPLPPPENTLPIAVEAGVQAPPIDWLDLLDAPLPDGWQRVVSPDGAFAVDMPYRPRVTTEATPGGVAVATMQLNLDEIELFGASLVFPRALTTDEQKTAIEAWIAQGISQSGTLVSRTSAMVAGFPAEHVVIESESGVVHAVIFATGMHVATFTATPGEADRFFESIEWLAEGTP